MRKSRKKQLISIVMGGVMAFSLFTGIGTMQVNAETYTSGYFSPTGLKEGDIIYKGVWLRLSREAVVCTECHMVWISGSSGGSERRCAQIKSMPEHSGHADKVYADQFSNFFGLYVDSNPVKENVAYTVVENGNLMFTITYNTDGGSTVSAIASSKLPNPLPETTKEGYDFVGWYTDAACTIEAVPGASISQNTTLYAKWEIHKHTYSDKWTYDAKEHWHNATCSHSTEKKDVEEHTYGETGEERYTCEVCGYVDNTKKESILAIEDAKKKIQDIGEVTYDDDCYSRIEAAQDAFNKLTDEQKNEITTEEQKVLTDAVANYAKLEADHKAAAEVVDLIDQIGEVKWTGQCEENIKAARRAYEDLSDTQKELVSNVEILEDAEKSYEKLTQDYTAIGVVTKKILAIGDVEYTTESKDAIDAARKAYNDLNKEQQELLQKDAEDTYKKLTDAEKKYANLKKDHEAAEVVVGEINAIGTVEYTEKSKAKIDVARAAYGELSDYAKTLITNYKVLTEAENTYAKLKEDHEKADAVVEKINAIQKVDKNSGTKIDEARKAYKNLTEEQKALITEEQYKVLTDAESAYAKIVADYKAVNGVVKKIGEIGTVEYTQESKNKIDEAREAYKNLTPDQQNIILTEGSAAYKVLTDAEAKYAELKAADDAEKAAAAVDKIEAIKKVEYTTESKAKIDEAKDVYDALTEDQKKLITEEQYKVLIDAEASYAKLKADTEAAKVVSDAIKAIGTVDNTKESKAKIDAARAGYDKLSDYAKTLITEAQYKVLTDAESTYAKLESSAEYRDNSLTMNSKFKIKAGKSVKVSWGKVKGADGYDVYLAYRGKGKKYTVKSTKASSVTVRKLKKKAINQKKNIKCYVVAYKKVNGKKQQIGKTKVFYAVGNKIKSATEPKAIQLKKSSYVLTVGKTAKVKATIVKKNKRRKLQKHTAKFRYATSDSKVAVVSKTGKITAKAAGTCKVYVYAANGCAKVVKVTVR